MTTNAIPNQTPNFDAADEVLLDVSVAIEPTPNDMRLIDVRYRRLNTVLAETASSIAVLMTSGHCLIYPQGSVSISTLVISGDQEDRCDVDAIVELDVPADWSVDQVLDELYISLKHFPDAIDVVRCSRCVQIQFATMHMDVTPIDKRKRITVERAGEIFHSPDSGASYRLPANPAGFSVWFRNGRKPNPVFQERASALWKRQSEQRLASGSPRELEMALNAEQVDLPRFIPSRLDTIDVVALKLLKRFLLNHYGKLDLKRPPSIWITKLAGDLGAQSESLTVQLFTLAEHIQQQAAHALETGVGPDERNPSYFPDRLNDRWPRESQGRATDLRECVNAMKALQGSLEALARAPIAQQKAIIDQLFGARVGTRLTQILSDRYRRSASDPVPRIEAGSGQIYSPAVATSRPRIEPVRPHHFHSGRAPKFKEPGQ